MKLEEWLAGMLREGSDEIVATESQIEQRYQDGVVDEAEDSMCRRLCFMQACRMTAFKAVAEWWTENGPIQDDADLAHVALDELDIPRESKPDWAPASAHFDKGARLPLWFRIGLLTARHAQAG